MADDYRVRTLLAAECNKEGSVSAWARKHGFSRPYISRIMHGRSVAGSKVRQALGLPPTIADGLIGELARALRDCRVQLFMAAAFKGYGDIGPLSEPFTDFALRQSDKVLRKLEELEELEENK